MSNHPLIEIARSLTITPEEIETLTTSVVCSYCDHRVILHGEESGFCYTEGCHCQSYEE